MTLRESREGRWDVVILPLIRLLAFDGDFWVRGYDILDGVNKFGRLFVRGMVVCNQLGIIKRERYRGHGRWWDLILCTCCNESRWATHAESQRVDHFTTGIFNTLR